MLFRVVTLTWSERTQERRLLPPPPSPSCPPLCWQVEQPPPPAADVVVVAVRSPADAGPYTTPRRPAGPTASCLWCCRKQEEDRAQTQDWWLDLFFYQDIMVTNTQDPTSSCFGTLNVVSSSQETRLYTEFWLSEGQAACFWRIVQINDKNISSSEH